MILSLPEAPLRVTLVHTDLKNELMLDDVIEVFK
jgi:hypothetical protein